MFNKLIRLFDRFGQQVDEEEDGRISRRSFFFLSAGLVAAPKLLAGLPAPDGLLNLETWNKHPWPAVDYGLSNMDLVALQLEHIRMQMPLLYERPDYFISKIEKREADYVSSRVMRIPFQ